MFPSARKDRWLLGFVVAPPAAPGAQLSARLNDCQRAQQNLRPSHVDLLGHWSVYSGCPPVDGASQWSAIYQYRIGRSGMVVSGPRSCRGYWPWVLLGDVHLLAVGQGSLLQAQRCALQSRRSRRDYGGSLERDFGGGGGYYEGSGGTGCRLARPRARAQKEVQQYFRGVFADEDQKRRTRRRTPQPPALSVTTFTGNSVARFAADVLLRRLWVALIVSWNQIYE